MRLFLERDDSTNTWTCIWRDESTLTHFDKCPLKSKKFDAFCKKLDSLKKISYRSNRNLLQLFKQNQHQVKANMDITSELKDYLSILDNNANKSKEQMNIKLFNLVSAMKDFIEVYDTFQSNCRKYDELKTKMSFEEDEEGEYE